MLRCFLRYPESRFHQCRAEMERDEAGMTTTEELGGFVSQSLLACGILASQARRGGLNSRYISYNLNANV